MSSQGRGGLQLVGGGAFRPAARVSARFVPTLQPSRLRLLALIALLPFLWNCGSKRLPVQTVPTVRSEPDVVDSSSLEDVTPAAPEAAAGDAPESGGEGEPSLIGQVLEVAASQIGTPYRWGGDSPDSGFDCSGFVRWVFEQLGVELPRDSRSQAAVGVVVDRKDLRPGDLLFYSRRRGSNRVGHVGIYLGEGQFLHSPRRGQPIQVSPAFDSYRQAVFLGARRVLSDSEQERDPGFDLGSAGPLSTPAEEPSHFYVVKRGDYIWALARRFKLSPVQLLRANNLKKDSVLQIGQRLVIPNESNR